MKRFSTLIVSLWVFGFGATASAQDLQKAYQKEMAYLQGQKQALSKRVVEVEDHNRKSLSTARSQVEQLQGKLSNLTQRADEIEEALRSAERESAGVMDADDTLAGVYEQAAASLKRYGLESTIPENPQPEDLAKTYSLGIQAIGLGQRVTRGPGEFFLLDGTQVKGTIVQVGRVASWGISENAAGALAPAGEGRLKLWPGSAAETARLAATSAPAQGGIFLYENTDKPAEQQKTKTAWDIVVAGGMIGWVICVLGLLALVLILGRVLILVRAGRGRYALIDEVADMVRGGRLVEAQRVAGQATGPFARLLADTVSCMRNDREKLEDAVSAAILREAPKIERFGSVILVFAAVSPLLGLLGTVTGMIATFDVITEFGTGDPKMLSGGISEALITTQLGLIVAIPCVLIGNLLNNRANGLIDDLQYAALRLVNANLPTTERPNKTHAKSAPPLVEITA
ncbi:MAG: MotA/TolQ/ExbB proton channel family protein [bacterium]